MLRKIAHAMIRISEARLGERLDYVHEIAEADLRLLARYNKVFGFLDPRSVLPAEAYHVARLVGALAADCGACVQIEINLAKRAGVAEGVIGAALSGREGALGAPLDDVARLSRAVTHRREDDAEARESLCAAFGEAGLIELAFAMNGAALLPGVKRAMGHATACDLSLMRGVAQE